MLDSDKPYSAQAGAMPYLTVRPLHISPEVRARVIETHSKPRVIMCGCEHKSHFADLYPSATSPSHEYMSVPAGTGTIDMIGEVCDHCADNHQW